MTTPGRLGDMLVTAGVVSEAQVTAALKVQESSGGRLGEILVSRGEVSEQLLAQTLSRQLSIPEVSLSHVEFSRDLLRCVPADLAERYGVIPVYVRRIGGRPALFVAMDDPTNEEALAAVTHEAGIEVRPMVAPPSQIRHAVRVYYNRGRPAPAPAAVAPAALAAGVPAPGAEGVPAARRATAHVPPPPPGSKHKPAGPPPAETPATRASQGVAAKSDEPPARDRPSDAPKKRRAIALTLLDGTTVRLPMPSGESAPDDDAPERDEHHGLTTSDLIVALRAAAQGKDVSRVAPSLRWEPVVAALLALLLKKHLVSDWEFIEELEKK